MTKCLAFLWTIYISGLSVKLSDKEMLVPRYNPIHIRVCITTVDVDVMSPECTMALSVTLIMRKKKPIYGTPLCSLFIWTIVISKNNFSIFPQRPQFQRCSDFFTSNTHNNIIRHHNCMATSLGFSSVPRCQAKKVAILQGKTRYREISLESYILSLNVTCGT